MLAASTDRFQFAPYERLFFGALTTASAASRLLPVRTPASPMAEETDADADADLETWALGQFRQTSPAGVSRALTALGRHHSRPWLREIDVPTAVVVMTRDKVIPTSRQVHLIAQIPEAEPYVVAAGHAGCVLDAARFTPVFLRATADIVARGD